MGEIKREGADPLSIGLLPARRVGIHVLPVVVLAGVGPVGPVVGPAAGGFHRVLPGDRRIEERKPGGPLDGPLEGAVHRDRCHRDISPFTD